MLVILCTATHSAPTSNSFKTSQTNFNSHKVACVRKNENVIRIVSYINKTRL